MASAPNKVPSIAPVTDPVESLHSDAHATPCQRAWNGVWKNSGSANTPAQSAKDARNVKPACASVMAAGLLDIECAVGDIL